MLLLFNADIASAQTDNQAVFRLRYIINTPEIDTAFVDNSARISDLRTFLQSVRDDSLTRISGVEFCGTASPDGSYEFNLRLSENRLASFKELVTGYIPLPDSLIKASGSNIPWDGFRDKVAESDLPYRDEILSIIDEEPELVPWGNNRHIDRRLLKLKQLHDGRAWELLKSPILRDLRYGEARFTCYRMLPPVGLTTLLPPPASDFTQELQPVALFPEPEEEGWMPRLYLKSNAIALAMLSANVAIEFDLARHWSVTLPIYYCGMDWFKSTIKFRNFTIQPELRYWFRKTENDGFFLGAHFGLSYYNFAFDGKYRYQDHRGRTPAIGGGLSAGYRMPISRNRRWRVEFTVGAGIYPLDYDLFDNTSDVKEGLLTDRRKETYIGLDQAAVTFSYSFDLKRFQRTGRKKGGRP